MNSLYKSLILNPGTIVELCMPENYRKEDLSEYLEGDVLYTDCSQELSPDSLYALVRQALSEEKILCLDHINSLVSKNFWDSVSQLLLFMLKLEDCCYRHETFQTSRIRLLLPYSEREMEAPDLETNLLEWSCKSSIMIRK